MEKRKIVLFDFDGVIADTFDLNFNINRKIDPGIKTEDDYRKRFDGNINNWEKDLGRSEGEIKKADEEFLSRYIPVMAGANVFGGMREILSELEKSYILIIISSTVASLVNEFLERNDLGCYFEKLDNSKIIHRNKTDRVKKVFEKYGVGPEDCVFITDTLGDMREAAGCGVGSIGVAWGFQKKESLIMGNPSGIAENPAGLPVLIADYFKN